MKTKKPEKIEIVPHPDKNYTGNIVKITWNENDKSTTTSHTSVNLRIKCPCASCKDKKISGISSRIMVTGFNWVGRYAIHFVFSDKHNTGIYTYQYLHDIKEKV